MFKKIALSAVVALSSSSIAHADMSVEICTSVGVLAENIMGARQNGIPMSLVMKKMTETSPEIKDFLRDMIVDAYDVPMFNTNKYKELAKVQFRDANELACFTSGIGKDEGNGA